MIKNIKRKTDLSVKHEGAVVGTMIFSYKSKCLSCMAVRHNHHRKGIVPRPLYKKYG